VRYLILLAVGFACGMWMGQMAGYKRFMSRAWREVENALTAALSHTIDTHVVEDAFHRLCREFNGGVTDKHHDKVAAQTLAWAIREDQRRDPRMVKGMVTELRKRVNL